MKTQRGQAMPLGLVMIMMGVLGALVLFNTGGTATDKARLANAADAAAYSGLLWQARALNFQAYTNRAMVANQVSVAQAVSIASWAAYGEETADRIEDVLRALPFVGPLSTGVERAMTVLSDVVDGVVRATIPVVDAVNGALSKSQQAMFSSSFAATPEIVRDIIEKSDAAGRFSAVSAYGLGGLRDNLNAWENFTVRHDADDLTAMDERALVINDSLDKFSKRRDWKFFEGFWFYSTPLTRHRVFKSGSTKLIAVDSPSGRRWEWMGKDTIALQNRRLKWNGKEKKSELKIGWGGRYANKGGGESLLLEECKRLRYLRARDAGGLPCGTWGKNKSADRHANRDAEGIRGYEGLRAFRTINSMLLAGDGRGGRPMLHEEPVVRLKVEASMNAADTLSSADSVGGETFGIDIVAAGNRLSSISIAELHYRRPDEYLPSPGGSPRRTDREAANGYNPYWDVRLAPIPDEERLLAVGLRLAADGSVPGGTLVPGRVAALPGEDSLLEDASAASGMPIATLGDLYAGADQAAIADRLSGYAALSIRDVEGFAVDVDGLVGDLKDELVAELRKAPKDILNGMTEDTIKSLKDALLGIGSMNAEVVERASRAYSDGMEAVAGLVAGSLGTYVEDLVETTVLDLAPDVARIDELVAQIETAAEGEVAALQQELDGLIATRDAALQLLRDDIVDRLIEITAEHQPNWDLPRDIAERTVDDFLEEFEGQLDDENIDVVDWEFASEEDEDDDRDTDEEGDSVGDPNEGDDHGNF